MFFLYCLVPFNSRRKRFVKKFFKGKDKKGRKGDMMSGSDDEASPEHERHSVKVRERERESNQIMQFSIKQCA